MPEPAEDKVRHLRGRAAVTTLERCFVGEGLSLSRSLPLDQPAELQDGSAMMSESSNADLYYRVASSGGVTQLHRVIDLVNSGASPERIKEWCEQQIANRPLI